MAVPYSYNRRPNPLRPVPTENIPKQLAEKLGSGLGTPLELVDPITWRTKSGVDKVKQDIYVCLSTPIGRHLLQPDYGSLLPYMVFEHYTSLLQSEMIVATKDAIARWVPQVIVNHVTIDLSDLVQNAVLILIEFSIKGSGAQDSIEIALSQDDTTVLPPATYTINGALFGGLK
mgnify:CR=1 FL=1